MFVHRADQSIEKNDGFGFWEQKIGQGYLYKIQWNAEN